MLTVLLFIYGDTIGRTNPRFYMPLRDQKNERVRSNNRWITSEMVTTFVNGEMIGIDHDN